MAIQILQNQYPTLGYEVGKGFGEGLKALAENKLQQMQWKKALPALNQLGFNNEQAEQLRHLPAEIRQQIILNKIEEPSRLAFQNALQPGSSPESSLALNMQQLGNQANLAQQPQAMAQQQDNSFLKKGLNQQQALQLSQLQAQRQQASKKEQQQINKAEKPYVEKISAYKEAADDADKRLNKMEALINKGGLPISGFYNLIKNLEESVPPAYGAAAGAAAGGYSGGPIGAAIGGTVGGLISPIATLLRAGQRLTSPNTEEFEKLSNDFIKNAKSIFGSRITDADLKAFMSTVPTLSQTDEGKRAIIKNMKSFNEASKVRYKAMRDIIKENGNIIPANLELLVEDRAKSDLDKIASDFEKV